MQQPRGGIYNGIYSYFIRGVKSDVDPKTIEEIKQYAIKVIESDNSMLLVGRNWIVVAKKMRDSESEGVGIRCFKDICEPHEEITLRELEYTSGVVENVEIDCDVVKIIDRDIEDRTCWIRYNFYNYGIIVAITVDPLDVIRLNNDREIQLLLDLIPPHNMLVRPM